MSHGFVENFINNKLSYKQFDTVIYKIFSSFFLSILIRFISNFTKLSYLFLNKGFIHGRELAKKTMMVYEMCRKLLGTTQFISEDMTQGKKKINICL